MSDLNKKTWQELSAAASKEKDPHKLMELVKALNDALERREQEEKAKRNSATPLAGIFRCERPAADPACNFAA